jgi:molybdopterin molybdotransferase
MIPVAEALARLLALTSPLPSETVPLRHAAGRWLSAPVAATRDQPPFPASAMDGYAVAGATAPGATFRVVGEALAGRAFAGVLQDGQAARIFTGAPVPPGTARIVLQEDVMRDGDIVTVGPRVDAGPHIRAAGQDFRAGDSLAPRRLRPQDLALLAAMNRPAVPVARRPEVAVIMTGDELVMPGEAPRADQIIASNGFAVAALAEGAGAVVRLLPIARDSLAALDQAFGLAEGTDVVVTIGGASVGDHDLVAQAASARRMQPAFWKIAMRPGKPLMAGRMGPSVMLGLPGNPVSAIVCAHLFLLPLLRALQGDPSPAPATRRAILGADVAETGPRAHYMRARLADGPGLPLVTPFDRQDSALLRVLSEADALLIRPAGDGPRAAGHPVEYLPLN